MECIGNFAKFASFEKLERLGHRSLELSFVRYTCLLGTHPAAAASHARPAGHSARLVLDDLHVGQVRRLLQRLRCGRPVSQSGFPERVLLTSDWPNLSTGFPRLVSYQTVMGVIINICSGPVCFAAGKSG